MGMSSPKTKAEAREKIAKLQREIEYEKARIAHYKASYGSSTSCAKANLGNMMQEVASKKAKIAELRAKIPSLP